MFVSRKVVFPGYPAMLKCRETDPCLPRMIDWALAAVSMLDDSVSVHPTLEADQSNFQSEQSSRGKVDSTLWLYILILMLWNQFKVL